MKRGGVVLFLIFFDCSFLFSMQSTNYKINNITQNSLSNYDKKISYTFAMDGNLLDIGYARFLSSLYSLNSGILALNRGPEPDVRNAYVFPNPCNLRNGCNAVTFTKLSLVCEIKIFNIAGEEIITLKKNTNSEKHAWDLKDSNSRYVPSGLYLFYIKDPTGTVKKGKIIIIR